MISVQPYTRGQHDEWDTFVARSNNGTIFHTQRFLSYHPDGKFNFHSLMFYDNNKLVAVLPAEISDGGTTLNSPAGSSYGGLVLLPLPYKIHEQIVDSLLDYAQKAGITKMYLTPPPFFYQQEQMQNIDYALALRGFDFDRHYISHIVEHRQDGNIFANFNATARNYARQFDKNPELSIEITTRPECYEEIYPILLENKAIHHARPTHTLAEMLQLQELFPDEIKLFIVKLSGKAIAATWTIDSNKRVTLCFYNMMLYSHKQYHPMYGLMREVIRYSQERGADFVDIGVSQDTKAANPMTPSYPLIDFKEKFGAKGMLRSTFRIIL